MVEDGDDYTLLWLAAGTPVRFPRHLDGRPVRDVPLAERFGVPWHTADDTWTGTSVLVLVRPRRWHTVQWFFAPDGTFRNWYVNVETPAVRWAGGLDADDLEVDVVAGPDRRCQLKDVDEAEAANAAGEVRDEWAARARSEAEQAIADITKGVWPYDGTWTDFRPDPSWPVPELPANWNQPVPGYTGAGLL
ncbi:DUF402 domain-containing protein [Fodinicola feengrottensis]|uniref:DUF402 domain-containing protein n=1 Tax=Fodinicola feengrottensis TaxID=435914 RepID=A0ABN2H548_9ACTN